MRTLRAPLVMDVLDLWAKGYTAAAIAGMVPGCKRKAVDVIVAQARSIGDPRAVLHCYPLKRGQPTRLVGNNKRGRAVMLTTPHIKIVPLREPHPHKRTQL